MPGADDEAVGNGGNACAVRQVHLLAQRRAVEVPEEHAIAARRGDRQQAQLVVDRQARGVLAHGLAHVLAQREGLKRLAGALDRDQRRVIEWVALVLLA